MLLAAQPQASVFYYIYVSTATQPLESADLVALLEACHVKNRAQELTGILLYKDGTFLQLLEGTEAAVRRTARRIATDPRHTNVRPLLEGYAKARSYPDWTMAFVDLANEAVWDLPGYSPFLLLPLTDDTFVVDPTTARYLLLAFQIYIGSASDERRLQHGVPLGAPAADGAKEHRADAG